MSSAVDVLELKGRVAVIAAALQKQRKKENPEALKLLDSINIQS